MGRFHIDSVPYGDYAAGFFHLAVDTLGIEVQPRLVHVKSNNERVDLGSPSPSQLIGAFCGTQDKADSTALIIGHVRDALKRSGVIGASVLLEWRETSIDRTRGAHTVTRTASASSREGGFFALCGVPSGFELSMRAAFGPDTTGDVLHESAVKGADHVSFMIGHARREFDLDTVAVSPVKIDTTRLLRGGSRLVGRVVSPVGAPLPNALIEIVGIGARKNANASGTATFDSLPPGTRAAQIRAIGYEPREIILQLPDSETTTVDLRMEAVAAKLEAVEVKATMIYSSRLQEFLSHKRRAFSGTFFEPSTERGTDKMGLRTAMAFIGVRFSEGEPSISVVNRGGGQFENCAPNYYLNGRPTTLGFTELELGINDGDLLGIEIYGNPRSLPIEYSRAGILPSDCGVIAIWTRPGAKDPMMPRQPPTSFEPESRAERR